MQADKPIRTTGNRVKQACEVDGCDREALTRMMCSLHYDRWRSGRDMFMPRQERRVKVDRSACPPGYSICIQCMQELPVADFNKSSKSAWGVQSRCRACERQYCKENRDKIKPVQDAYRERNKDVISERRKRYRDANPEVMREQFMRWYSKDEARMAVRAAAFRRRARLAAAPGSASREQMASRWDYYGGRCWMCGDEATCIDHVKPIAKGGSNWASNLRPACAPCNISKKDRWPFAPALGVRSMTA